MTHRTFLSSVLALAAFTGCTSPPPGVSAGISAASRDPFYKRHADAGGVEIRASEKISDAAVERARQILLTMTAGNPALLEKAARARITVSIVGAGDSASDLPELRALRPRRYYDIRGRNAGATAALPVIRVGEENLMGYRGDLGAGESLLVKSFASTVAALPSVFDEGTALTLDNAYEAFLSARIADDPTPVPDRGAYWADGVQSWFDAGPGFGRDNFKRADPALASLVGSVFGEREARLDPAAPDKNPSSPEFVTPPEFAAWEIRFKRGEETLAPPGATILPMLPPWLNRALRPGYLKEWKSPAVAGIRSRLFFVNASESPVRLETIDAEGRVALRARLFPTGHIEPETTAGEVWRISDLKTRRILGYTIAQPGYARRVIKNAGDEDEDFASEGELDEETPTALAILPPEERTVWASSEPSRETTVFIVNESSSELLLELADRAGELTPVDRLRPGDHVTYDCFRDQVWRVSRAEGTLLGYVVASSAPGVATIRDKATPGR